MAISGASYGSVAEVLAFTRHLLDGQPTFNSTTRPTLTEVEKFIDRASGVLNVALAGCGLTTPLNSTTANSTAKLMCADWVVMRAAEYTELTQRGTGFSAEEGSRTAAFRGLYAAANEFAEQNCLALKRVGAGVTDSMSQGLSFTGLDAEDDRADPDDTSRAQPKFVRGQFDYD